MLFMNKLAFMRLWDLYNKLLTPTQQEITNEYFNLDLTITEIAESKGVSRQSVSDCLSTCKKQLEEFEEKLGYERLLTANDLHISFLMTDVNIWADKFLSAHPEYEQDIKGLKAIIGRDYSQEIERAQKDVKSVKE
jgi:predicted DNA-binding protein YlxM (UPF0122 family)